MPCGKIASIKDGIERDENAEAQHFWQEFSVLVSTGHSYDDHGSHVTETHLIKHVFKKNKYNGKIRNVGAKFISREIHRIVRDVFLNMHSSDMKSALLNGDKVFMRTLDFREPIGSGFIAIDKQGLAHRSNVAEVMALSATFFYKNVGGVWHEVTGYPTVKSNLDHPSEEF